MLIKKQKFEPVLSEAALAVICYIPASAASLNTGSNSGVFQAWLDDFAGWGEDLTQRSFVVVYPGL